MMDKGTLPLGMSDFESLRLAGQIYIDKTDLVLDLASGRGRIFFSRPRRFGKSLLVSTFETLFRDGLKHFSGLRIDGKWDDGTYGVVKLDLSKLKDRRSIGEMRKSFEGNLRIAFGKVGFAYDPDGSLSCLEQIDAWLDRQEPGSLVLLVDEYDAPLNMHLDDPAFFDEIRDMLSEFFSLVKSADRAWRFVLVTGVARFNKASIFSAFNNLKDISLNPRYGTLLGYTEDEILSGFGPFVENAARANGMDVPSLMAAMRARYDGFCFDAKASTRVYAPWSVLSFLDDPEQGLRNFWYDSAGQSSMILNYMKRHYPGRDIETFGDGVRVALDDLRQSNDAETLAPEVLLYQAGYLTIRRTDPDTAWLGFPNGEVAHAMSRLMAERLFVGYWVDCGEDDQKDPAEAAGQGDAQAQFDLGVRYANGDGVPKDKAKAVECWGKAAERGLAKAQLYLGVCYANGDGVPQDKARAAELYRKAAEKGNAKR